MLSSEHHKIGQLEPTVGSLEGGRLVGVPPSDMRSTIATGRSIYAIFVKTVYSKARICLICGANKCSLERALGCIRSHLGLRPFTCGGVAEGCGLCDGRSEYVSTCLFYAYQLQRSLHDFPSLMGYLGLRNFSPCLAFEIILLGKKLGIRALKPAGMFLH